MGRELVLLAPAKINLYLEVRHRRGDGYHDIVSIFQTVSLHDRLTFRSLKEENRLELEGDLPPGVNTVTRCVDLIRRETGIHRGLCIRVEKEIPLGAGLGGGSSDAAAVVCGLNRIWRIGLSASRLHVLCQQIGSDVPFFLIGKAALVWGRGEHVQSLKTRRDFLIVLVHPGFPVNTTDAYQWLDAVADRHIPGRTLSELKQMYEAKPIQDMVFYNAFQQIVERRFPQITAISGLLTRYGACHAGISGSGSVVMGLFTQEKSARAAVKALNPRYPVVKLVKPL